MNALWAAQGGMLLLAGGLIAAASFAAQGRWLRPGLALAGVIAAVDALWFQRGAPALILAVLIALFNSLAILKMRSSGGPLDSEADSFARRHLAALSPGDARLLIGQGQFVSARAGEELTREGSPVDNLYFLLSGCAAVLVNDAIVGKIGPGDLIGEASLLTGGKASATVRLAEDSRLWFAERDRLSAFLAVQPGIASALRAATMAALRDKLERANRGAAAD